MRKFILTKILFLSLIVSYGQESLKIMQYNLTYYGNISSFGCDDNNNNTNDKNGYLSTIIDAAMPDVFGVNEMGYNLQFANSIRDNALNTNGRSYYERADLSGEGGIVNMLYYNTNKLTLYSQEAVSKDASNNSLTRYIDFYTLYLNTSDLAQTNDTVFFTFIVAHLKAGSDASDLTDRARATEAVMDFIDVNNVKGYKFMMGDFNTRSSNEVGFQNLVNYSNPDLNFVDPINKLGNWNSNSFYGDIHTQSTRSSDNNSNCFITGGSDDRFDFILMDNRMEQTDAKVKYVSNTYQAYGNDGTFYNNALKTTNNGAVSDTVALALYNMSDHLPVVMTVEVEGVQTGVIENLDFCQINFTTPLQNHIAISLLNGSRGNASIYNASGSIVVNDEILSNAVIPTSNLMPGVYFLKVTDGNGNQVVKKLVK